MLHIYFIAKKKYYNLIKFFEVAKKVYFAELQLFTEIILKQFLKKYILEFICVIILEDIRYCLSAVKIEEKFNEFEPEI